MGSVGGWLSAAVTLCVFVIFHKLSGHEAKPSEPASELPCTEGRAAGPPETERERERRARRESIEGVPWSLSHDWKQQGGGGQRSHQAACTAAERLLASFLLLRRCTAMCLVQFVYVRRLSAGQAPGVGRSVWGEGGGTRRRRRRRKKKF